MKKIILSLFILTSTGCNSYTVEISKEEWQMLRGDTIQPKYPKPFKLYSDDLEDGEDGIVLGSDGHDYLVINNRLRAMNVEHYIECERCQRDTSQFHES